MTRKSRTESAEKKEQRLTNLKSFNAADTNGGTVNLPSRVPPDLKQWVIAHSKLTGKSASRIVREAIELYRTNNHHEQSQTHSTEGTSSPAARNGESSETVEG
jgi:hypothetical protein